jgi:hypothetical protein
MARQTLKDKELTKLKKVIKKLKEQKKKRKKQKRDQGITQKVSQKVVIGSNIKDKTDSNVGRSFPQIQFLPQTQSQSFDSQLLRELLLQKNMSPLTRPVKESVSIKPGYDLADQYGIGLDTPVTLGLQTEPVSVPIPSATNNDNELPRFDDDTKMFEDETTNTNLVTLEPQQQIMNDEETIRYFENILKPPPEKQGTLDTPLKEPKPIGLGPSIFDSGDETEREFSFDKPKRKSKVAKIKPEIDILEDTPTPEKKKRGKSKKTLEREKMAMEDKMGLRMGIQMGEEGF